MPKSVVATYIAEQDASKRPLLEKLSAEITKGLPGADVSLKWGVPVYQVNGRNICALACFKDSAAVNFFASPDVLSDPKKKLEGAGKTQRMLKVRTASDVDGPSIQRWLKAASTKAATAKT